MATSDAFPVSPVAKLFLSGGVNCAVSLARLENGHGQPPRPLPADLNCNPEKKQVDLVHLVTVWVYRGYIIYIYIVENELYNPDAPCMVYLPT